MCLTRSPTIDMEYTFFFNNVKRFRVALRSTEIRKSLSYVFSILDVISYGYLFYTIFASFLAIIFTQSIDLADILSQFLSSVFQSFVYL